MKYIYLTLSIVFLPLITNAQGGGDLTFLINSGTSLIVQVLIPLAFALTLLYFFWGVAKYIKSIGSEKDEGKQIMVWGIIALFIASSIWGILAFIQDELGIEDTTVLKVDSTITP
jgi:hypothetical protein